MEAIDKTVLIAAGITIFISGICIGLVLTLILNRIMLRDLEKQTMHKI
jgi:hypothetical protein